MPLVPELAIAMLACARIGANSHGYFSADFRRMR
jgi:acyl-coenzyme A synthetase/AMP-(fatty) acid ligase